MDSSTLYLAQSDTTVGFLSQNALRLDIAKRRGKNKRYIKAIDSLEQIKSRTRFAKNHRNLIRRKWATFISHSGESFRVIREENHLRFIKKFGWLYTTSANLSGERFSLDYVMERADCIVFGPKELKEKSSSMILKLGKKAIKRTR